MKITCYLKERKALLILGAFFAVFPGIIMIISSEENFLESNGFYSLVVTSSIFIVYLLVDYFKQKLYCKKLLSLLNSDDLDFVVSLPKERTYEEKLYYSLLMQLKRNGENLIAEFAEKQTEDMDFIETWVHEIKTPIAAAKLIIENSLDNPTERALYDISDEIEKIEDMVQKTICYSQLNDFSKDCQIGSVNLKKVFNKCMQSEYSNIINKHLKLDIENIDFEVNSDEKWLYFIVKQILDNAVKYSKDEGEIHVYGENSYHNQKLIIEDFGIGISKEDIRRIFNKGYTGINGRKKAAATGVGLYLSNKLAAKLGHKIKVFSEMRKGTKVEIILKE